jgi:hypothetical protein
MEQLPVPSKPALPVAPPTLPPPAPTGRDPHPGLVIALPLLALGLFSSGATTWFGTDAGDNHAGRPVPVSAVAVAAGGHALTVTVPVRCTAPVTATAAETASRVTVAVRPPAAGDCATAPTRVAVNLRRTLGDRAVVDAATGHALTVRDHGHRDL